MSSSKQKLREEIEHLRGNLGGTVEAWVHKTDLPARAKERANDVQLLSARSTVTYELVSLASGVLGGALAGAVFNRIWRAVSNEGEAPKPTGMDHSIREVLVAGALHGAVFGLVKAALGRITAKGYRQFTGHAPNR
jgi:hypothetical protein